jgi:hypothetical protein
VSEQLHEFIEKQHARDLVNAERYTRIETLLQQQGERLFGGPNQKGALVFLHEEHEKAVASVTLVSDRVGKLETWKTGTVKWLAGAVAVLTLEGTALAFFANHVATAVKAVQAIKGH